MSKFVWVCRNCGHETNGYFGQCSSCGAWGTLEKETIIKTKTKATGVKHSLFVNSEDEILALSEIKEDSVLRLNTGSEEFNRVLGGGVVPASVNLIGGQPGIGKSTLLLQLAFYFSLKKLKVLYVSAEESSTQLKMRAKRLQNNRNAEIEVAQHGTARKRTSSRLRRTNDRSVLLVHEDHEDDENAEIGVSLHAHQLRLFGVILVSAFLGALIPICTCGMIPLALGLYRKQLDWKIILAFLLAGNACSVPALILNYGIFGLEISVYRLLMAIAFAVLVTYVLIFFGEAKIADFIALKLAPSGSSASEHCCADDHHHGNENHAAVHEYSGEDHLLDDENAGISLDVHQHKLGISEVLAHIREDLLAAIKQFLPWILLSVALASLLHFNYESLTAFQSVLTNKYLSPWIFSLIAFPFYFCAGADIPMSQEFLNMGVPIGAVLAFMTASPSVNLTTVFVYKQAFGLKAAIYLTVISVVVIALLSAFCF
ncbi:MAG: permease [Candidatus Melainabacteria bacterium]|nr:permease [Candidatus Melainabacteria bacterium]